MLPEESGRGDQVNTLIGEGLLRESGPYITTFRRLDRWPDIKETVYTLTEERPGNGWQQFASITVIATWEAGKGYRTSVRPELVDPTVSITAEAARELGRVLATVSAPGFNPCDRVMA